MNMHVPVQGSQMGEFQKFEDHWEFLPHAIGQPQLPLGAWALRNEMSTS